MFIVLVTIEKKKKSYKNWRKENLIAYSIKYKY